MAPPACPGVSGRGLGGSAWCRCGVRPAARPTPCHLAPQRGRVIYYEIDDRIWATCPCPAKVKNKVPVRWRKHASLLAAGAAGPALAPCWHYAGSAGTPRVLACIWVRSLSRGPLSRSTLRASNASRLGQNYVSQGIFQLTCVVAISECICICVYTYVCIRVTRRGVFFQV